MQSWVEHTEVFVISTMDGREDQQASITDQLTALGIPWTGVYGQALTGTTTFRGVRIRQKKLTLCSSWRAILDVAGKLGEDNGVLVLEDDIHTGDIDRLPGILEAIAWDSPHTDVNMLALGAKDAFVKTVVPAYHSIGFDGESMVNSQWTGNLANYLTPIGFKNFRDWFPETEGEMLEFLRKERALDLTWSRWPGVYRIEDPLVSHIPAEEWSKT